MARRRVSIAASLQGHGNGLLPPNATLIFDVSLIKAGATKHWPAFIAARAVLMANDPRRALRMFVERVLFQGIFIMKQVFMLAFTGLLSIPSLSINAETAATSHEHDQHKDGHAFEWSDNIHRVIFVEDGRQHVFVSSVWPNGWEGMFNGDQIEQVNGQPLHTLSEMAEQWKASKPHPIELMVSHGNAETHVREKHLAKVNADIDGKLTSVQQGGGSVREGQSHP